MCHSHRPQTRTTDKSPFGLSIDHPPHHGWFKETPMGRQPHL